jgi:hypothetical protein
LEDINKSDNHLCFLRTSKIDSSFRNGFWRFATERFFYLEDISDSFQNIFHFENDNMIFFNVQDYLKIFENFYKIGLVFDNDERCIPGITYFKNKKYISELANYILTNYFNNDMEYLSNFRYNSKNVKSLPIIPDFYLKELKTLNGKITTNYNQYCNLFSEFNSIFDAAAIGQFLYGYDPRNAKNYDDITAGFINESCLFRANDFIYKIEIDDKNRHVPYAYYQKRKIKINNLHMHCKKFKLL